ncbi:hypothetical protein HN924_02625 [Candidatus Woesearchaeota archaeon]|jgi:hypothetical protein|nr:hypothetical protein [Candidatus Woesearchaeota archaeon]MBT7062838.1 hypothetical protein [Candidatus Woesearchaeota archaeon]MBT7403003.1 hypothetical protein [Candidatus Woesearchaeota archaeon]
MDRETEKRYVADQIRVLFLTKWAGKWVAENELRQQNRLWSQVFQELVQQKFIEKKHEGTITKYKWKEPLEQL